MQKYFYRDVETRKVHWTRGVFSGWTQPGGLLNARYAIFSLPSTTLLIPRYLLTPETRALLPVPEKSEEIGQPTA